MKALSLIVLCFVSSAAIAQIYGKKTKGAITIFDSVTVKPGDTIYLGRGSAQRGEFSYIYQPPNVWAGSREMSLGRNFANMKAVIKFFKNQKTARAGEKVVAVVNFGGFNEVADLEPAIEAGEIIAINNHKFRERALLTQEAAPPTTQVNIQQQPASKADELKKLKELLDTGVLTQEEYDSEKKKILDKP
jgi:hypothetical protein